MAEENKIEAEAVTGVEGEAPQQEGRGRRGRGGDRGGRGGERGGRGRRDDRRGRVEEQGEELIEKCVYINRHSKTDKGGKRFGFATLGVVGDGKGREGSGHGNARAVPVAISKASAPAQIQTLRVPLREGQIG